MEINGNQNLTGDLEDSNNPSFEELLYETDKGTWFYFYKAKSIFFGRKARIIIERQAISVVNIDTNLANDPNDMDSWLDNLEKHDNVPYIKNGFKTLGIIQRLNLKNQKLNVNDSGAINPTLLDGPIISVNIDLSFLKNEIYLVSLVPITSTVNISNIYLIEDTDVKLPDLVNTVDENQLPNNTIALIPLSAYNANKNGSVKVLINQPLLDATKLINSQNKIEFTLNNKNILFSNIQCFINTIRGQESTNIIPYKYLESPNYITTLFPIKLSFNSSDQKLTFTNEWIKFIYEWTNLKKFIKGYDISDLLIINKTIQKMFMYTNVKILKIKLVGNFNWYINDVLQPSSKIEKTLTLDYTSLIGMMGSPSGTKDQVNFLDSYVSVNKNSTFRMNINLNIPPVVPTNYIQIFYKDTNFDLNYVLQKDNSPITVDLTSKTAVVSGAWTESNLNLLNTDCKWVINYSGRSSEATYKYNFTFTDNSGKILSTHNGNIEYSVGGSYIGIKLSDKVYDKLNLLGNFDNNNIINDLLKRIVNKTTNFYYGFKGRKNDSSLNPTNQMGELHQEFETEGANPLQIISNEVNLFINENNVYTESKEWELFFETLSLLGIVVYSIYSFNNGMKETASLTLPFFLKLQNYSVFNEDKQVYEIQTLISDLKSFYFDVDSYNQEKYDGSMFAKFNSISKAFSLKNSSIEIKFPFIGGSILEASDNHNSAQNYDIEKEEIRRYLLYLPITIDSDNSTNADIFDNYMENIFILNDSFEEIDKATENFDLANKDEIPGEFKYVAIGTVMPPGWVRVSNYDDVTPTILANNIDFIIEEEINLNVQKGNDMYFSLKANRFEQGCFSILTVKNNLNNNKNELGFLHQQLWIYDPDNIFIKNIEKSINNLKAKNKFKIDSTYKSYLKLKKEGVD